MAMARRGFASLLATMLALFVFGGVAFAQETDDEYVVEEGEASGPETVVQGTDVTFTGDGFEPESEVTVEVLSEAFTYTEVVTANQGGVASFTFAIPCTAMQGQTGTVTFTGPAEGGDTTALRQESTEFTIGGEVAACPEGLPTTGAAVTNGLIIAAAALILGLGFLAYSRRGRDKHVEQS